MADKKLTRSSYDDYIETLNKLTPQLRSILAHISGEQQNSSRTNLNNEPECSAGAMTKNKKRATKACSTATKTCGSPVRKKNVFNNNEDLKVMQAVTNCGKIVYGTVKEGKLDVQGTVGEINQDLLGIESVNAGRKSKSNSKCKPTRSRKMTSGGMHKLEIGDGMD
ncbi:core structural protein [Brazilian porcupinepox virus 1]|nr:core structural protein [Brazilian porcupinepox virus 1]